MFIRESIVEFSSEISGTTAKDVMDLLVLTQYFDTLTVCIVTVRHTYIVCV